jgi:hypothetical protein
MMRYPKKIVFSTAAASLAEELGRLLQPNLFFRRPRDVVRDPCLTVPEKRAILSSWAANSCAAEAVPYVRYSSGRVVKFDDVVDALHDLD